MWEKNENKQKRGRFWPILEKNTTLSNVTRTDVVALKFGFIVLILIFDLSRPPLNSSVKKWWIYFQYFEMESVVCCVRWNDNKSQTDSFPVLLRRIFYLKQCRRRQCRVLCQKWFVVMVLLLVLSWTRLLHISTLAIVLQTAVTGHTLNTSWQLR